MHRRRDQETRILKTKPGPFSIGAPASLRPGAIDADARSRIIARSFSGRQDRADALFQKRPAERGNARTEALPDGVSRPGGPLRVLAAGGQRLRIGGGTVGELKSRV